MHQPHQSEQQIASGSVGNVPMFLQTIIYAHISAYIPNLLLNLTKLVLSIVFSSFLYYYIPYSSIVSFINFSSILFYTCSFSGKLIFRFFILFSHDLFFSASESILTSIFLKDRYIVNKMYIFLPSLTTQTCSPSRCY